MPNCTKCGTPGAYLGFNSIECRNPDCEHFKIEEEKTCACCGKAESLCGKATTSATQSSPPCPTYSRVRQLQAVGRAERDKGFPRGELTYWFGNESVVQRTFIDRLGLDTLKRINADPTFKVGTFMPVIDKSDGKIKYLQITNGIVRQLKKILEDMK